MTLPFTYNQGELFVQALSDFWNIAFSDRHFTRTYMKAVGHNSSDAYFTFLESVLGTNIKTIPTFRKQRWTFLSFKRSDMFKDGQLEYGDGAAYGDLQNDPFPIDRQFIYNDPIPALFRFNLGDNLTQLGTFIFNKIHNPSLVFVKGRDYIIDESSVIFTKDPFTNPLIPIRKIYDSAGEEIDREIGLWSLNSDRDYEDVWKTYGSLLGVYQPSSEEYKSLIETLWVLAVQGPNTDLVEAGLHITAGLPVSKDTETIQELIEKPEHFTLLTNLNSYKISKPLFLHPRLLKESGKVSVGSTIKAYTPITNGLELLSGKNTKWWSKVSNINIPAQMLQPTLPEFKIGDEWILTMQPQVVFNFEALPDNSTVTNKIDLQLEYLNTVFEKHKIFHIEIKTPGPIGIATFNIKDIDSNENWEVPTVRGTTQISLLEEVGIPFKLIFKIPSDDELKKDFVIPESHTVVANNVIGSVFGIGEQLSPPNEYFTQIGMRVGGFVIGESNLLPEVHSFDLKDYLMENFFGHNYYYVRFNKAIIELGLIEKFQLNLLRDLLPAHTFFLSSIPLPNFNDILVVEDTIEDTLTMMKGVPSELLMEPIAEIKTFSELSIVSTESNCGALSTHFLLDAIPAEINHTLTVEDNETKLKLRDSSDTLVAELDILNSQKYYVFSDINLVITFEDIEKICDGDEWKVALGNFSSSTQMGYIDGGYGPPRIGSVGIGEYVPQWVIGTESELFPMIQVHKRCSI